MGISLKDLTGQIRSRLPGGAGSRPTVRGLPAVTALEVDGRVLRIAEATRSGNSSRVDQVRALALELPDDADRTDASVLGTAIAKALAKARIKPGPVVLGIGRSQVILRTVAVPDTGLTGTIASLVRFQVARDLPFRLDEAIIDFQILRRLPAREPGEGDTQASSPATAHDSVDRVEVLVAVTRQESLEFLRRLAEAAGLSLAAVGWISQANATCLQATGTGAGAQTGPRALVALKSEEVGIEILEGSSLLFSRGLPMPPAAETDAEQWVRTATIEVVRSLHAFGGTAGRTAPEAAAILGGTGHEEALSIALQTRLGFAVPQVAPAHALGLERSDAAAVASGFSSIGLALGATHPSGLAFDFLNPKRPPIQRDLRRLKTLAAVAAVAAVFVALLVIRTTLVRREAAVLDAARTELNDAKKKSPFYRKTLQQAATVEEWLAGDRDWTDLYAHLSAVLPPAEDLYLKSFTVTGQGSIRIGIQARSGEIIARLDQKLRAAGYDVRPVAITPGSDRFGYDFASTVEFVLPKKLRIDLPSLKTPPRPSDDASLDPAVAKKGGQG